MTVEPPAILLMAYGAPRTDDDLAGYLREVMGRTPSDATVQEYRRRYRVIGGSPQMRIAESIRSRLEQRLRGTPGEARVFLATKHWTPRIQEVLPAIVAEGHPHIRAIPLSPFASTWILQPYQAALREGQARSGGQVELRAGWHRMRPLVEHWATSIRTSSAGLDPEHSVAFLTAHSLPERMLRMGDPYPGLVREMAQSVATTGTLPRWEFTYQSAGNTTEPWLGPDITERMTRWKEQGDSQQLVAPIGFLFDHLEVLYDLDIVVRGFAEANGIEYHRVPMPNDDPAVIDALAEVALAPHWPPTPVTTPASRSGPAPRSAGRAAAAPPRGSAHRAASAPRRQRGRGSRPHSQTRRARGEGTSGSG